MIRHLKVDSLDVLHWLKLRTIVLDIDFKYLRKATIYLETAFKSGFDAKMDRYSWVVYAKISIFDGKFTGMNEKN